MLWTITIILFILWVVGLVSSYTFGGWIHILLVLAVIVLIFNLLQGRRAL
jgi:phage-related holin